MKITKAQIVKALHKDRLDKKQLYRSSYYMETQTGQAWAEAFADTFSFLNAFNDKHDDCLDAVDEESHD